MIQDPTAEPTGSTADTPSYDDLTPVLRLDPPRTEVASRNGSLLLRLDGASVQLLMAQPYLHAPELRGALQSAALALEEVLDLIQNRTGQGLIDALKTRAGDLDMAHTWATGALHHEESKASSMFVPVTLDGGVDATVRGKPTLHWPTDEELAQAIRAAEEPKEDVVLVMELPGPGEVPLFHTITGGDRERICDAHGIDIE